MLTSLRPLRVEAKTARSTARPATSETQMRHTWQRKHSMVRSEEGVEQPSDASLGRCDDLKRLAVQVCTKKRLDLSALYVDVSQSAERRPWTVKALRAITTSTQLWCHGRSRHLSIPELYDLLGFGEGTSFEGITPHQAKNLLGESMAVPCVTLVLMSVLVHLPGVFARRGQSASVGEEDL